MSTLLAPRLTDYWLTLYRRTWRGTLASSFVTPLLYVLAIGVLLGGFIKGDPAKLEGAHSYLEFIAPGMVAAQATQLAIGEMTYPVMGALKWHKTYFGMIATPLAARDIVISQLGFMTARIALTSAVFLAVMAPFGAFRSLTGVLVAWLVQLLIGVAFAAPTFALSSYLKDESGFALVFRLGLIPMTLFSGAFFPIANLSDPLEFLAKLTPLWHGVDLTRMLVVGHVRPWWALVHVAYLVALALAGYVLVTRQLDRRLIS